MLRVVSSVAIKNIVSKNFWLRKCDDKMPFLLDISNMERKYENTKILLLGPNPSGRMCVCTRHKDDRVVAAIWMEGERVQGERDGEKRTGR